MVTELAGDVKIVVYAIGRIAAEKTGAVSTFARLVALKNKLIPQEHVAQTPKLGGC